MLLLAPALAGLARVLPFDILPAALAVTFVAAVCGMVYFGWQLRRGRK